MKKTTIRRNARRGQGMTEYIIIVALIAIAAIGIITLFGDNIRRLFAMSADSLAGNDSVAQANSATAVDTNNGVAPDESVHIRQAAAVRNVASRSREMVVERASSASRRAACSCARGL